MMGFTDLFQNDYHPELREYVFGTMIPFHQIQLRNMTIAMTTSVL